MFIKILKNTIFHVCCAIIIAVLCTSHFNHQTKQLFLTLSISLRTLLIFILPFLIITSISSALSNIPKGAKYFVILLLLGVCISNFLHVILGFSIGNLIITEQTSYNINPIHSELTPFWTLKLPVLISGNSQLIIGFLLGFILNVIHLPRLKSSINFVNKLCMLFLSKIFVPCIPLFIFGYMVKIIDEKLFSDLLENNLDIMLKMVGFVILYILFHIILISNCNIYKIRMLMKSLIPPMISSFSTMSSSSALPFTLSTVEKNVGDKNYANFVCPTTMNIHMVGDTICIPIMSILLMNFYGIEVSLQQILIFACYFTLTKFSGAGIPGGTIFIMLPVLEKTLGFTAEMCSLITSMYIIIDCITSSSNVVGNNIFAIYLYPLYKKLFYNKLEYKEVLES
ncbi:Glutamate-aspartate carrier protein [Rickettsiales bacterium Ac37b]|nr:Glutamate-aspartate carrier protein [Rickettsiales bacterium Ac37b]